MNRGSRLPKVVEWVLVGSMGITFLLTITAITVFALAGNLFFISIIWFSLGAATNVGLQFLIRRVVGERGSYWGWMVPVYILILLGGLALFAFFPGWFLATPSDSTSEWVPSFSGPLSFYLGFIAAIGGANTIFRPKDSGRSL